MMFYGVKLHVVTMFGKVRSLLRKLRKGVTQLSGVIIGIVVVMMVAIVGVLIGGVFTQKTSQIFTDQNVSSEWVNLANQASSYSITGLSLLLIGIIVAAAMSVIAIIVAYFRQRT